MTKIRKYGTDNPFSDWLRKQPELDSQRGFGVTDIDYAVLKYKIRMSDGAYRFDFKAMLHVEIKTNDAVPYGCQLENLWFQHQVLTKDPCVAATDRFDRDRFVFHFGVGFVRCMFDRPDDGGRIHWGRFDGSADRIRWFELDEQQLIDVLALQTYPDEPLQTLEPDFYTYHAGNLC